MIRNAPSNICAGCGFLFQPTRRNQRHCPGGACKQRAYRSRRAAAVPLAERRAQLLAQIERDNRISLENARQFCFDRFPAPKLVITRCYGVSYPALGRLRQAERRLRRLPIIASLTDMVEGAVA